MCVFCARAGPSSASIEMGPGGCPGKWGGVARNSTNGKLPYIYIRQSGEDGDDKAEKLKAENTKMTRSLWALVVRGWGGHKQKQIMEKTKKAMDAALLTQVAQALSRAFSAFILNLEAAWSSRP